MVFDHWSKSINWSESIDIVKKNQLGQMKTWSEPTTPIKTDQMVRNHENIFKNCQCVE